MAYEFGNLSPADFEDLVRDLIGREFGVRFLKPLRQVPTAAWTAAMPKGRRPQYFKRSTMRDLPTRRLGRR